MKKMIFIFICLFLCSGCKFYDEYKIPEGVNIEVQEKTYEVFSTLDTKDLIKSTNVDILNHKIIELNSIGKKEYTIEYKYGKRKYKYVLNYQVIDTVKPIFLSAASSKTVLINQEYDPCSQAVYADNYDREPLCTIEGKYDLTTPDTYKVKYVLTDNSNNVTTKSLNIKVVEELENKNPTSPTKKETIQIEDIINTYKNNNTMIGIDVSRYQNDIDFERVKNAGVEFVILRIGIQSDSDKDLSMDSKYLTNIENAKKAGLKVGVYLATTATNEQTAKEHATWVISSLNNVDLDLPIAFDWENWSSFKKYQMSIHDLNKVFWTFAKTIEENGYQAMLYSSKYYLEIIWDSKDYPVWLAHYTSNTTYDGNYIMWQRCNIGIVDGIDTEVDVNILYSNN